MSAPRQHLDESRRRGLNLAAYRGWTRAPTICSQSAARGAFASFGRGSVIQLPVRLGGESRIAIGSEVFVGAGSWIQVLDHESPERREPTIHIGDGTSVAGTCVISVAASITIGRKVLMARNVYAPPTTDMHSPIPTRRYSTRGTAMCVR